MTTEPGVAGSQAPLPAEEEEEEEESDAPPPRELERRRSIALAVAEGHDADIPSSEGYVLDERGEAKRRRSIA